MERYTQWRDRGTGISPFAPILQTRNIIEINESIILKFIRKFKLDKIILMILFIIKVIIISPFLIISLILNKIIGLENMICFNRFIMFLTGLISIEFKIENIKKHERITKNFYPSFNEIFFMNFTSPLDFIIMCLISQNEFVILLPNEKGELIQLSSIEFIKKSYLSYDLVDNIGEKINFKNLEKKIIYIFAEGTTSNGKSILPFSLNQESFNLFIENFEKITLGKTKGNYKINTISVKLYPSSLVTPINISILKWIYKLLTNWRYDIKLKINLPNELNSKEKNLIKIRNSFTNNGKFKLISNDLNIESKKKFIENYVGRR